MTITIGCSRTSTLTENWVNEEIIRAGFSEAQTQYPYRSDMKRRFEKAEEFARLARVGMWSDETPAVPDRDHAP